MKAAIYLRVSSVMQARKETPIESQRAAIREYAQKHGIEIVREYVDAGLSGRTEEREQFQEMVEFGLSRQRDFDVILLWKFDRWARDAERSDFYKAMLRQRGVQIISITEPVTADPQGRLTERLLDSLAQYQSEVLAENVVRSKREIARRGYWNGGKPPAGYRLYKVKDGAQTHSKLEIDPEFAPLVKRIFALAAAGHTVKGIHRILYAEGVKAPSGAPIAPCHIYPKILTNEVYLGRTVWNATLKGRSHRKKPQEQIVRVENTHPRLIDDLTFARVQELLAQRRPNRTPPRQSSSQYLFSGLAFCGRCGAKMGGRQRGDGSQATYMCAAQDNMGGAYCHQKPIRKEVLEDGVISLLIERVFPPERLALYVTHARGAQQKNPDRKRLRQVERQIAEKETRRRALLEAIETRTVDFAEAGQNIKALREQLTTLEEERRGLMRTAGQPDTTLSLDEISAYIQRFGAVLQTAAPAARREILKAFVERIEVDWPIVTVKLKMGGQSVGAETLDVRPALSIPPPEELQKMGVAALKNLLRRIRNRFEVFPLPSAEISRAPKEETLKLIEEYRGKL